MTAQNPNYAPPFNNPDYLRGFEEGQRHSSPSAETNRRLNDLAKAFEVLLEMNASIKVMEERTKTILDRFKDYDTQLGKFEERLSKVEQTQSGLVAKVSIGASFVAAVVAAVINKIV